MNAGADVTIPGRAATLTKSALASPTTTSTGAVTDGVPAAVSSVAVTVSASSSPALAPTRPPGPVSNAAPLFVGTRAKDAACAPFRR